MRQLKPIEERDPYAAAVLDAFDRLAEVPAPMKGLTFRKGGREANVHDVRGDTVFYGIYQDGEDLPVGMYQATLDEWGKLALQAVEHGAAVFTMVRATPNALKEPARYPTITDSTEA